MRGLRYIRRVDEPTDGVVDGLRLGEGLVTTLVPDDPEAGPKEARPEPIQSPKREAERCIEVRVGKRESSGSNERVQVSGTLVEAENDKGIPNAVEQHGKGLYQGRYP